jgi:hypothetical protein
MFLFFAQSKQGRKSRKKAGKKNESMKAKKNKRQQSRADAPAERRTARRAGSANR